MLRRLDVSVLVQNNDSGDEFMLFWDKLWRYLGNMVDSQPCVGKL